MRVVMASPISSSMFVVGLGLAVILISLQGEARPLRSPSRPDADGDGWGSVNSSAAVAPKDTRRVFSSPPPLFSPLKSQSKGNRTSPRSWKSWFTEYDPKRSNNFYDYVICILLAILGVLLLVAYVRLWMGIGPDKIASFGMYKSS